LAAEPGNAWYLDLATDIDLGQNKANEAINRLADARNRANQMRPMVVQSSEDFYLAKARTLGMYNSGRNQLTSDLL
ncbi:hypothetical protein QQ73_09865, partial [Candidatus Endoriftia persephone str. Guaymas]|nr:hypothetical protein [Candidatus Endoriftia persephone str. Guaymas]